MFTQKLWMQILLPQFKIGFALHASPDNLRLKYASLILPSKKKPSTPATYITLQNLFLQLNAKTKIATPLRRKKKKETSGELGDHMFMSTFRKMETHTLAESPLAIKLFCGILCLSRILLRAQYTNSARSRLCQIRNA